MSTSHFTYLIVQTLHSAIQKQSPQCLFPSYVHPCLLGHVPVLEVVPVDLPWLNTACSSFHSCYWVARSLWLISWRDDHERLNMAPQRPHTKVQEATLLHLVWLSLLPSKTLLFRLLLGCAWPSPQERVLRHAGNVGAGYQWGCSCTGQCWDTPEALISDKNYWAHCWSISWFLLALFIGYPDICHSGNEQHVCEEEPHEQRTDRRDSSQVFSTVWKATKLQWTLYLRN